MKILTTEQFNALSEEKKRYWQRRNPDDWTSHDRSYTPIQIDLEDAERVLEYVKIALIDHPYELKLDYVNMILTAAMNNLKQLTK